MAKAKSFFRILSHLLLTLTLVLGMSACGDDEPSSSGGDSGSGDGSSQSFSLVGQTLTSTFTEVPENNALYEITRKTTIKFYFKTSSKVEYTINHIESTYTKYDNKTQTESFGGEDIYNYSATSSTIKITEVSNGKIAFTLTRSGSGWVDKEGHTYK